MDRLFSFVTHTRGRVRFDFTDTLTYVYLFIGTILMFGPVLWLVLSSFKSPAQLSEFPPRLLPYQQDTVKVQGYDKPLSLFNVKMDDGSVRKLAEVQRIGIDA